MLSLTVFLAYCLVFVQAVPLVKRVVVDPPITSPDASTVWTVDQQVTVTWDTSSIPEPKNFTGMLVLGFQTSDSENLDLDHPLATNISLIAGQVTITVPNVAPKNNYIVVLFGDSGNASPQFTINGGTATSTVTASSSTSSLPAPSASTSLSTSASALSTPSTSISATPISTPATTSSEVPATSSQISFSALSSSAATSSNAASSNSGSSTSLNPSASAIGNTSAASGIRTSLSSLLLGISFALAFVL